MNAGNESYTAKKSKLITGEKNIKNRSETLQQKEMYYVIVTNVKSNEVKTKS